MRRLSKPLIGGRRGSGKSCEFVLQVDMSETDSGCTMKWETALGAKLLQKSVQDALLGPLLEHIYKPKINGPSTSKSTPPSTTASRSTCTGRHYRTRGRMACRLRSPS